MEKWERSKGNERKGRGIRLNMRVGGALERVKEINKGREEVKEMKVRKNKSCWKALVVCDVREGKKIL